MSSDKKDPLAALVYTTLHYHLVGSSLDNL